MAGIEVATGELVSNDATWVFDTLCPTCGSPVAKDTWGLYCVSSECVWSISACDMDNSEYNIEE